MLGGSLVFEAVLTLEDLSCDFPLFSPLLCQCVGTSDTGRVV